MGEVSGVRQLLYVCLFFGFAIVCEAQNIKSGDLDSLLTKDFEFLENKIFEAPNDTLHANKYALLYLRKAKKEGHLKKEIDGYYILSIINDLKISLVYSDSAIYYSKKYKINDFLGAVFLNKGNLYYTKGDYEKAIENYLFAKQEVDYKSKPSFYYMIMGNIAHSKSIIGEDQKAIDLYKEILSVESIGSLSSDIEVNNYLDNLFGLADSYKKIGKLDSATVYNGIGVRKSIAYQRDLFYSRFVLNEATNLFDKKNYAAAMDSANIAIPILEKSTDSLNLAVSYLYKAKILDIDPANQEEALLFFEKTDSIVSKKGAVLPYFVKVYEWLYAYYKNSENLEKQLFYLEKLIAYNAKIDSRYKYMHDKIQKEFDTPKLLDEKNLLIDKLESQNKAFSFRIFALYGALVAILLFGGYFYRNRMLYKKRYENLLIENNQQPPKEYDSTTLTKIKSANISENVVRSVLESLDVFENENRFLDNSITLNKLSKILNTNPNYLSKIINVYKNKNFSTYLSTLRMDYAVLEIRKNPKIRSYTIKAIAQEFGYGNAETFTKAFYKKTGIYPSYYIKQLEKKKK